MHMSARSHDARDEAVSATTSSILKEQFALIAILVLLIGTVFTDYYYASFGIRYQSLNLPASHILYRGFSVLRACPYVCIPYVIAALWLIIDNGATRQWVMANRIRLSYLIVAAVLFMSYWLASVAGLQSAATDLSASSSLPKVKLLVGTADTELANPCSVPDVCRLLLIDTDYIYVFVPATSKATVPNIIRLDKKAFNEISTGTQ
jgi:hypothetical protein